MKLTNYIANIFRNGTAESSMRLIFVITALATLTGLLTIDIKFAMNITKYSGMEIASVIGANSLFLVGVIYGKNKEKTIENDGRAIDSKIDNANNVDNINTNNNINTNADNINVNNTNNIEQKGQ
jgi:hypothetical protein